MEKITLQQEHDEKRKDYLDKKLSHDEFYLWLADAIHTTVNCLPYTLEQIKEAMKTDMNLNNLPLREWDRCDGTTRCRAVSYGMQSWSLSNTVCVLKAFGRREAAK